MQRRKNKPATSFTLKLLLALSLHSLSFQSFGQVPENFFFALLDSLEASPLAEWVIFDEKALKAPRAYHVQDITSTALFDGTGLDVPSAQELNAFINLLVKNRQASALMFALSKENHKGFAKRLSEEKLHPVYKYLPLVLSALNPKSEWGCGAGLWHLYFPQAVKYGLGLSIDKDERFHPEKAGKAAIRHLKALHAETKGNPRETLLAYVFGKNYKSHVGSGNNAYTPESFLQAFSCLAYIMESNSIPEFSQARLTFPTITGINLEETVNLIYGYGKYPFNVQYIRFLNPASVSGKFSPGEFAWILASEEEKFNAWLNSSDRNKKPEDEIEKILHKIRPGDNLGRIASKYNVQVSDIREWNKLRSDVIRAGQVLVIYKRKK